MVLRLSRLTQADPQLHALGVTIGRVADRPAHRRGLDPRRMRMAALLQGARAEPQGEEQAVSTRVRSSSTKRAPGRLGAISISRPCFDSAREYCQDVV